MSGDLRKAAQAVIQAWDDPVFVATGVCRALDDLRAALAKCDYSDCVDNGPDGKCIRWLLAECEKSEDYQR
jgi:hypothetical protein